MGRKLVAGECRLRPTWNACFDNIFFVVQSDTELALDWRGLCQLRAASPACLKFVEASREMKELRRLLKSFWDRDTVYCRTRVLSASDVTEDEDEDEDEGYSMDDARASGGAQHCGCGGGGVGSSLGSRVAHSSTRGPAPLPTAAHVGFFTHCC